MNGATVIGRILGTVFVPQLGVFNVAITCVSICAILIFCTIVVKTVATTFMFAVLYGIFCGACEDHWIFAETLSDAVF